MAAQKDYYKILGVKKDATQDEIKKAFRKLSIKFHPDKNQGSKDAEAKFKEVAEAYSVLGDENKRKEYDAPKSSFKFNGSGGFDDIFTHFTSGGFDFDFGSSKSQSLKGSNIKIKLELSLEEMYSGVKKKIKYKPFVTCSHCGGSGMTEQSRKRTCKTCGGTGTVFGGGIFMSSRKVCPTCGGSGYTIENPCPHCNGHGISQITKEIDLEIPKGVCDGLNLSYSGLGNAAAHGNGVNGDLIVSVIQKPHKKFEVIGNDLHFDLRLKVINALLGCKVNITTLDGRVLQAKISKGTCDGDQLRFKGYGMPIFGGNSVGNMVATVKLVMPNELNARETELLKELRKEEHFR